MAEPRDLTTDRFQPLADVFIGEGEAIVLYQNGNEYFAFGPFLNDVVAQIWGNDTFGKSKPWGVLLLRVPVDTRFPVEPEHLG